jgi:LysR family transcriptional regulator, chromosome initiation inhibitor
VCNQEFFDRWFAEGLTASVFAQAPSLSYNLQDRLQVEYVSRATESAVLPPTHFMADAHALLEGARRGIGWVMLPHPLADPLVEAGDLVLVSRDNHVYSNLTWNVARATQGVLQTLTRSVRATARRHLVQDVPAASPST